MDLSQNDKEPVIVFSGGRLIDGNGGPPITDAVIVIRAGRIEAAGSREKTEIPPQARPIDIAGLTIMPGLIDAHIHVGNIEISMYQTAVLSPAVYVLRTVRNLETAVDLGFTTLRDAGGLDMGFKEAIEAGLIRGPRLFLSVSPLSTTGGHFDMRRWSQHSVLARNSLGILPEICDGPDAVCKSARDVIRRGADQVKVAAGGGVDDPGDGPGAWQFSVQELKAAVSVAAASGRYVMAHAYAPQAIRNCLEAGVASIEHGNLMDADTAQMIADSGAFYVPTLTIFDILANEAKDTMDDFAQRKLHIVHEAGFRALELACRAGVQIGSGSDILGPYHHLSGREFRLKSQVMTPMESIVSATRTNAEIIGMQDRIGTLTPGKLADLIVVAKDPLSDPGVLENGLENTVLVMKEGKILKNRLPSIPARADLDFGRANRYFGV
jgi:imidazolonepropionase-like amidohydrolase